MGKRWRVQPHDSDRVASLERTAGISPIIAQLLAARQVTPESVASFLANKLGDLRDPEMLPGLTDAADQLFAAVQSQQRIVIYGDYDADGMTAAAILLLGLRFLGADVGYYVPNRLEEGYGLNDEALERLAERGAEVVVSVDCGIASVHEAETARRLGLQLIITDHHEFGSRLPDAAGIIHPRLPGHSYPFDGLCGAGVAFKLAWGLCTRASESKRVTERLRHFLLTAIGLAAIGTVADVVPLRDENRILVHHGLKSLRQRPTPGMAALMKVTEHDQKPELTSEDIAFGLGPRLNAAGRLGQAQLGVELLTTDSAERATALAEYIHQLNSSRESLERSVYLAAHKQLNGEFDPVGDPAFVLAGRGWHPGVIGIVAGRLVEKYHRPVVLVALDDLGVRPGTGSGRSACGLNLHEAFGQCRDHLLGCGGHAAAAGLRIAEDQVDAFRAAFCEHVAGATLQEERIAEIVIDAEAPFAQLTMANVQQIERLSPFGAGNPRPILCASNVVLAEPPKRIGKGERHLAVRFEQHQLQIRGVAFGGAEWHDELVACPGPIDIAFRPVINVFRGRRSVEMHLVDWRPSQRDATRNASLQTADQRLS